VRGVRAKAPVPLHVLPKRVRHAVGAAGRAACKA